MKLATHAKTGLVYPEASKCEASINEAYMMKDYGGLPSQLLFKDAIVMDCGANIGAFAKRAVEDGAKQVEAFEPFPACYECLEQNVKDLNVVNIRKCAVSSAENAGQPLTFYYKEGNLEASTLDKPAPAQMTRWKYQSMEVPTVDFWKEVAHLEPSIVKMDIEGEEWRILRAGTFPDYVRFLAIEFHRLARNSEDGKWSGVRSLVDRVFGGELISENRIKAFDQVFQGTIVVKR